MTLEYNQILVAIDGSREAELAFKKSVAIASRNNAALHLVSIIDISFGSLEAYAREYARETQKSTEELLQRYKQEAMDAGITSVDLIIELGSPKTMITEEVAPRVNADLIICGATGQNAAERIFLGSVSERIVRAAECDVLVVRNQNAISK
jgi:nucleotide-binding universal stress UspA family protein